MTGYFIDSDSMSELWVRLTEIDLDDVNSIRDALGFAKGILYPIKLGDYEEVKPLHKAESEDKE